MKKRLFVMTVISCLLALCVAVLAIEAASTEFSVLVWRGRAVNYYHYNEETGKREKITIEDAVIAYVFIENCDAGGVHSGVVELYYEADVLKCAAFKSYVGGSWEANVDVPGRVRLAFSTGAQETEDGVILAVAFTYYEEPDEGDTTGFTLNVPELCGDSVPAPSSSPDPSNPTDSDTTGSDDTGDSGGNIEFTAPDPEEEIPYEYGEPADEPPPLQPTPAPEETPEPTDEPTEPGFEVMKGDVNQDGKVNTQDAVFVLKFSAGMIGLTDEQHAAADTKPDNNVNTADAVLILKYAAGMIAEF